MSLPIKFDVEGEKVTPTPEQQRIIEALGNVLIRGGPGVGKTFTMTEALHYTYMHLTKDVLGLTFSRSARRRWVSLMRKLFPILDVEIKTFHSFAYGWLGDPDVISEKDTFELLIAITNDAWKAQVLGNKIDRYKSCGTELYSVDKIWYNQYETYLKRHNKMDYNDMLRRCLECIDQRFDRVFVDEYQDTSGLQYEILHKIANEVVGMDEPCQRIYMWRDADERNIQRLLTDYSPKPFDLTVSHRHAKTIIEFLETLYTRDMTTMRDEKGLVRIVEVFNDVEEAEVVVELLKDGKPTRILARERKQFGLLKHLLGKSLSVLHDRGQDTRAADGMRPDVMGSTMHSVKGDEEFRVIVLGCNESCIPHYLSNNLTEEKNLFYTACSRAMDELYLITYGKPSRWLLRR